MILLDTNVLSELMRPKPQDRVVRWLDARPDTDFWITAVTASEIRLGIALLPDGKRKRLLFDRAERMLEDEFGTRCLPYDCEAASVYPAIVAERRSMGRPITVEAAQIASIALTAGLTLATRNTADFEGIRGLSLVDPWLDSGS